MSKPRGWKVCTTCLKRRPAAAFYKIHRNWYNNECKKCQAERVNRNRKRRAQQANDPYAAYGQRFRAFHAFCNDFQEEKESLNIPRSGPCEIITPVHLYKYPNIWKLNKLINA